MLPDITLLSAFLVGVLSSTHCVGMCGGIVTAVTLGARPPAGSSHSLLTYQFVYNAGRIASYAVAGAALGLLGAGALQFIPSSQAQSVARAVSALFTVALGLYLAGWWLGLGVLERVGARVWRRIEPLGRRLLPVDRPAKALLLGLVWGWLPCGLVYSALAWALAAGNAARGATLMIAFGLGTLPMLLVMGTAARSLARFARYPGWRRAVGVVLIALGIYLLFTISGSGAHPH